MKKENVEGRTRQKEKAGCWVIVALRSKDEYTSPQVHCTLEKRVVGASSSGPLPQVPYPPLRGVILHPLSYS